MGGDYVWYLNILEYLNLIQIIRLLYLGKLVDGWSIKFLIFERFECIYGLFMDGMGLQSSADNKHLSSCQLTTQQSFSSCPKSFH